MDFAGVFETHFTIGLDGASGIDALRDWGQARGLKCLHILLDRGASTPELSLAWKILWLETDIYPQGKDLYDATLLAEHVRLSRDLLSRVLEPSRRGSQAVFGPACIRGWQVDWENFQREYPTVVGTASDWQERLVHALEPTFGETNP